MTIYLDYNATAPLREAAWVAMAEALRRTGNPSSVHRAGREARRCLEQARESVARAVNAPPAGVIFTSGGTEANNLALRGLPQRRRLASAVEHPSILSGQIAQQIPVDADGVVDLTTLERLLAEDPQPALVAVMLANNETGVLQPIPEVVALAHRFGALVHGDAIQALGKLTIDIAALGIDSLSLSAHKIGGPPGVGALVLADTDSDLAPLFSGGGQERRYRAGTENVAGIAGFAAALADLGDVAQEAARLSVLRDRLEQDCAKALPGLVVFAQKVARLPNTSCLALPGVPAQTLLMALDLAGFAVSAGSACSSGKLAPSTVLRAMGAADLAGSAIRVSLGWASRPDEVDAFVQGFVPIATRLVGEHCAA